MEKLAICPALESLIAAEIHSLAVELAQDYESFEYEEERLKPEEIEHKSRDGFIAFTNGGFRAMVPFDLSTLEGSGKWIPCKRDTLSDWAERLGKDAREEFARSHAEELQAAGFDPEEPESLDYSDLYEKGAGALAEDLSECEREWKTAVFYLDIRAIYYAPGNYRGPQKNPAGCVYFDVAYCPDEYGREKYGKDIYATTLFVGEDLTPENIKKVFAEMRAKIETQESATAEA